MRLITLSDGTGMGGELIVFNTNAPISRLKELELLSKEIICDGGTAEDVPIWANILSKEGYEFNYVNSHTHVTAYGTSKDWLERNYPQITEKYIIEY